jgi:6-phosphogluconolactonase (cycloisomerase 2 family)
MTAAPTLQLTIGPELISFEVDSQDLSLRETGRVAVAAPIQYVWPHPSRALLYVASSNRSISRADDLHSLATVEVDTQGALRVIGQVALPTRPIHLTVEPDGRRVLVCYNAPSRLTVHPIGADGVAGDAEPQQPALDTGIYPHQVLAMPSGAAALLVARGNDARNGVAQQPGSLRVFGLRGREGLASGQVVAPGGGFGFGPRHVDFHPGGRWMAASIERQNELHIYALDGDRLSAEPVFKLSTWPAPVRSPHDQLAGTLHFHPNGKILYLMNRNDTAVYGDGKQASDYEGNNIAVYAFDEASGRPELLQNVCTDSVHVRTFSLDRSGTLLVAASILPALARRGNGVAVQIPARLSFFRVAEDGRLTLARTEDMGHGRAALFWSRLDTLERPPA